MGKGGGKKGKIAHKVKIRSKNYKHRYGVTLEELENKYKSQAGKCDCCGKRIPKKGSNKVALDHNHISMKVRGLLCRDCNMNLIATLESKERVVLGFKYLLKWEPEYVQSIIGNIK